MSNSSFDSFRQRFTTKTTPDLVVNRPIEKRLYEAFTAKDKVVRLDIRCSQDGIAHAVPYNYLINISYNYKSYTEIFLTVSGLTVMIKGRNLKPLVDALKMHICEFIEEYDSAAYLQPSDINAPFVEWIQVEVLRGPSTSAANVAATG